MERFLPSAKPTSPRPFPKAATTFTESRADLLLRNPIAGVWAFAECDHAAAPPRSAINSRRRIPKPQVMTGKPSTVASRRPRRIRTFGGHLPHASLRASLHTRLGDRSWPRVLARRTARLSMPGTRGHDPIALHFK